MNFSSEKNKRIWVEKSFLFLSKIDDTSNKTEEQLILNPHFFPNTYSESKPKIENIFKDLSKILNLNSEKISLENYTDLRDCGNIPYSATGKIDEIFTSKDEHDNYIINISNSLQNTNKKLLYNIVIEFIRIKLMTYESFLEEDEISEHFLFLAGIYFGLGIILFENRSEVGTIRTGLWKKSWSFHSPMLPENIVYSFAFYLKLYEIQEAKWLKNLPTEFQREIIKEVDRLNENPRLNEILKNPNSEENLKITKELVKYLIEPSRTSTENNNIGYQKIKAGLLDESTKYFREAIEERNNFGYAYDNLGYVTILLGDLDGGLIYLTKASETGENNKGYFFRNHAIYYHKKGNLEEANEYFTLAFKHRDIPIDFLEYHFAELLFDLNEKDEAMKFLKIAVDNGEKIAIEKMETL